MRGGHLQVLALPVGTYTVTISHDGFQDETRTDVDIRLGRTTNLGDIRLVRVGVERVVVTAPRTVLDPSSAAIGSNLQSSEYELLPVERDYRTVAALLPHANASYFGDGLNFGGATGFENKFYVDGVEVTDPYLSSTGTRLPYNFVREIEVKLGGYEAEFRSALGANVNAITLTGTNDFSGQVFGFFANNRFGAEPRLGAFEAETGDFQQYDAGFSLAGPIVHDKLWFSAAYNPTFDSEDVQIPSSGGSTAPGSDVFPDETLTHIFASKLRWQVNPTNNLTLTVTGDPTVRDAVGVFFGSIGNPSTFLNPDPYLVDTRTGGVNTALAGTHVLGSALLETQASVVTRKLKYTGATEIGRSEPLFRDTRTNVWSGGYATPTDNTSLQATLEAKVTFDLGAHTIKTGAAYRDNKLDYNEVINIVYQNASAGQENAFQTFLFDFKGTVHNRIPSVFVQDSWRVTNGLRLNAGLRWDGQYLVGPSGDVVEEITDQLHPRVGFVYEPGAAGHQRFFGSYGRFHQELALRALVSELFEPPSQRLFLSCSEDPRVDQSTCTTTVGGSKGSNRTDIQHGQFFDEFALGYERQSGRSTKAVVRGLFRGLGRAIENGNPTPPNPPGGGRVSGPGFFGNPGVGAMSNTPEAKREYSALELTLQRSGHARSNFLVSYVLSKTWGNYPGTFNSDFGYVWPNANASFDYVENMFNARGLLPNDRTHVFKASGSYRTDFGLHVGTSMFWQTGTPLSEFGSSNQGAPFYNFVRKRGSAGRTPSVWDFNLRLAYDVPWRRGASWRQRLLLDWLHIGSQRKAVNFDQVHFFGPYDSNGNQQFESPTYGLATRYQAPMTIRLGTEFVF
jgi:hypothetical protein